MSQQISPFLEGKYGWNFGESGWNTGMDENLLKFSFMFDSNIDGIVSSLPAAVNGKAYFLTTDGRLYFAINSTWYSSPTPKWFVILDRSTGNTYRYDGTNLNSTPTTDSLNTSITVIQATIAGYGTAVTKNIEYFASQAALDVTTTKADNALAGVASLNASVDGGSF